MDFHFYSLLLFFHSFPLLSSFCSYICFLLCSFPFVIFLPPLLFVLLSIVYFPLFFLFVTLHCFMTSFVYDVTCSLYCWFIFYPLFIVTLFVYLRYLFSLLFLFIFFVATEIHCCHSLLALYVLLYIVLSLHLY